MQRIAAPFTFAIHTMALVNRKQFQNLSNIRIREAQALFHVRKYSGAYYLAGYAVECALKACIARSVNRFDFPERQMLGRDPYVHDLAQLAFLAGLKEPLRLLADSDSPKTTGFDVSGQSWAGRFIDDGYAYKIA